MIGQKFEVGVVNAGSVCVWGVISVGTVQEFLKSRVNDNNHLFSFLKMC